MLRFKSKVDVWMWPLLCMPPIAMVSATVSLYMAGDSTWVMMLPFNLLVVAVYGGLVFPMYYELQPNELLIKFGLASYRIPYTDITGVKPSRNPLSAPALSLSRLSIERTSGSEVLISPVDRERFLQELSSRVTGTKVEAGSIVAA